MQYCCLLSSYWDYSTAQRNISWSCTESQPSTFYLPTFPILGNRLWKQDSRVYLYFTWRKWEAVELIVQQLQLVQYSTVNRLWVPVAQTSHGLGRYRVRNCWRTRKNFSTEERLPRTDPHWAQSRWQLTWQCWMIAFFVFHSQHPN